MGEGDGGSLGKANDIEGVVGVEAAAIDLARDKGIRSLEDLGKVGETAGKVLRGVAAVGTAVSFLQTIYDLKDGNYKAAAIHGLDTGVGAAALFLTAAVVGTTAAPIIAGVAIIYGFSRAFWGD